jgi:hypothetical protein
VENWFTAGELSRLSCAPDLKEVVFSAFPRSLILSKPTVWQLFSFFDYDEAIADVRRRKENAIDEQDFELAAALRDDEKHLLTVRSFVTILEEVLPAKFPNLVSLTIDGFGDSDLIRIPPLSKLESLTLIAWPTISRLQGINKCPSLKHLELRECGPRESFSLDSLSEAVELKSIRLDLGQSCILDLAPLAPLSSLSDLYVDLCGDIDLTRYAEQRRRHGGALTLHVAPGQIVHGSIPASNITIRRDERRHSD